MNSQRAIVAASILIPDHDVYPARTTQEASEVPETPKGGEQWPSPPVPDEDHGEW